MRADLTTKYLGLSLKNPLVASAGPLTGEFDTLCRLERLRYGCCGSAVPV